MFARTSTTIRLKNLIDRPGMPTSAVFSKKKLSGRSIHRLAGDLENRLEMFRSKPAPTPAEIDSMVAEIKESEGHEIAYTNKYANLRLQTQISGLRDIIEELKECQKGIDELGIERRFIPRYLGRKGNDVANYLNNEENLRHRNTECRKLLHPVLMETQRRQLEETGTITRGPYGMGVHKKNQTMRRRRPKQQITRQRRKKRKSSRKHT